MKFRIPVHALTEMERRQISRAVVDSVLNEPEQVASEKSGRSAYQSRIDFGGGTFYLVRVIVDTGSDPPVVVTVYRTSKTDKYWETS